MSPRSRALVLTALSILLVGWIFRRLNDVFLHHGIGFDESHFVWGGWCIRKGLVPYRDFIEFKPPLLFLTHALALAAYGYHAFQFRWFFIWFPLASLISLQLALLSRKIDKICALALILAIVHLWTDGTFHDSALSDSESIGLTYYFFGLACLIARTPFGDRLKVLGGVFMVCTVLSKEPFLPAVGVTVVGCFLLDARRGSFWSDALRYLKMTALGALLAVLALCIYLVPTGGMRAYIAMVRSYWAMFHDPAHSYCVLNGRFAPTTPLNDLWLQFKRSHHEFLNLGRLGYLIPIAALYVVFLPRRSPLLAFTGLISILAGIWAVTASNCQWMHYYTMTMSGLFFALFLGMDAMARRIESRALQRWLGWALLAGVLVALWPRIDAELDQKGARPYGNSNEEAVSGIISFIRDHTEPGDRILTTGAPALYVQTDRISAVRQSALIDDLIDVYPGKTPAEKLTVIREQLERNRPKVVYFDPGYEDRRTQHYDLVIKPFLAEHHYQKIQDRIWLRPD